MFDNFALSRFYKLHIAQNLTDIVNQTFIVIENRS